MISKLIDNFVYHFGLQMLNRLVNCTSMSMPMKIFYLECEGFFLRRNAHTTVFLVFSSSTWPYIPEGSPSSTLTPDLLSLSQNRY